MFFYSRGLSPWLFPRFPWALWGLEGAHGEQGGFLGPFQSQPFCDPGRAGLEGGTSQPQQRAENSAPCAPGPSAAPNTKRWQPGIALGPSLPNSAPGRPRRDLGPEPGKELETAGAGQGGCALLLKRRDEQIPGISGRGCPCWK